MSSRRVLRGGSYYFDSRLLRTTDRIRDEPVLRRWNGGFRVVVRRKKP